MVGWRLASVAFSVVPSLSRSLLSSGAIVIKSQGIPEPHPAKLAMSKGWKLGNSLVNKTRTLNFEVCIQSEVIYLDPQRYSEHMRFNH